MKKNYGIVMKFYRVERWLYEHKFFLLSKIVFRLIYLLFNCYIPPSAKIGKNVEIAHGIGIVFNSNVEIGGGCIIYQNVTIGNGKKGGRIGKNCVLGAGCVLLGDIVVGDNVKIGANAVVLEDIPDNTTAVGVPARIIKR